MHSDSASAATADKDEEVVDAAVYAEGRRLPYPGRTAAALELARERGGFVWLGLLNPSPALLHTLGREYGWHRLAVEDAINASHQRPKVDVYDDWTLFVLKTVTYLPHERITATTDIVATAEILVFASDAAVVTVRRSEHGELTDVRRRLEAAPELLGTGPAAVVYAIVDRVVDDYLAVAEAVELDVDEVEGSVFSGGRNRDIERIYQLKREVLEIKRAVGPLSAPLRALSERTSADSPLNAYLRDVEDHLIRVREQIGAFDEVLTSILQASLAQLTVVESEDMRRISAWVAIVAVPTMIAGIYGMNFEHMPELKWRYGYPMVLTFIAVVCGLLYRGFKRNGWL